MPGIESQRGFGLQATLAARCGVYPKPIVLLTPAAAARQTLPQYHKTLESVVEKDSSPLSSMILATSLVTLGFAAALGIPSPAVGQEAPPPNMVADEIERSRSCVPVLARLADLNVELEPLAQRVSRIEQLYQAVALEDSLRVTPFDDSSPEDRLVQEWFTADGELARRYVETEDEALLEERQQLRSQLVQELEGSFEAITGEADDILGRDGDLPAAMGSCDGAILIRSAVVEACDADDGSAVCQEAREGTVDGQYRFVDEGEDLWDVEQLRPWSSPTGIGPRADGGLGGAATGTLTRRGNVQLALGIEPIIRDRESVTEEEAAEFDANLEAMGFTWDDPRFVMSPGLVIELDIDRTLADESHYLLHFEDLSDPPSQVFWSTPAGGEGPILGAFPSPEPVLARLMSGEEVTLTAVRLTDEEEMEGEVLYSLGFTSVGQAQAVTSLLQYMASGQLSQDLTNLFPPEGGDEQGDG